MGGGGKGQVGAGRGGRTRTILWPVLSSFHVIFTTYQMRTAYQIETIISNKNQLKLTLAGTELYQENAEV